MFHDQVVFILEKVHIIWEPLLLPSTYKKSLCMVLESVFARVTKDILLLDDMAAEETLQVRSFTMNFQFVFTYLFTRHLICSYVPSFKD